MIISHSLLGKSDYVLVAHMFVCLSVRLLATVLKKLKADFYCTKNNKIKIFDLNLIH